MAQEGQEGQEHPISTYLMGMDITVCIERMLLLC